MGHESAEAGRPPVDVARPPSYLGNLEFSESSHARTRKNGDVVP